MKQVFDYVTTVVLVESKLPVTWLYHAVTILYRNKSMTRIMKIEFFTFVLRSGVAEDSATIVASGAVADTETLVFDVGVDVVSTARPVAG